MCGVDYNMIADRGSILLWMIVITTLKVTKTVESFEYPLTHINENRTAKKKVIFNLFIWVLNSSEFI